MIYPPFILPKHYLVSLRLLFDLPCPIYYAIKTPQIHVRFYSVSCLVENEHNSLHILESYSTIPFFFLLKDQSTPLLAEKKQIRTRQNKKFYFDSSIYRGTYPVLILDHLVIWKPCNRKMVFFYVVKKYNGLISTKQSEVLNQ